eukprot:COSAG01_NODE_5598_length_4155_cov_11.499014_5_plen_51_part_00
MYNIIIMYYVKYCLLYPLTPRYPLTRTGLQGQAQSTHTHTHTHTHTYIHT